MSEATMSESAAVRRRFTQNIEPEGLIYINQFVARLTEAGFTQEQAKIVLAEAYAMDLSPEAARNFQRHFKTEDGQVDVAKVRAMSYIQDARMTIDTYEPILEQRADSVDNEKQIKAMHEVIELMHAIGYSADEIKDTIELYIKISKSATPHPTEHHSEEGIGLDRKLVKAAEESSDKRETALLVAQQNLSLSNNLAASKRADIVDEADNSNTVSRIHNQGANDFDRALEDIIEEVTGVRVDINTNTGQKSWDYDADGKPNAEGFSMMMKIVTTSNAALNDAVENIQIALDADSGEIRTQLEKTKEKLEKVIENMKPIFDRSREITRTLAQEGDSEERKKLYKKFYEEEFETLFTQLSKIYDEPDKNFNRRGLDLYEETLSILDDTRKDLRKRFGADNKAYLAIDNTYRTFNRNGFTLEKGQTRHNDLVYAKMLDNLFKSEEFLDLGMLTREDNQLIYRAGSFSKMTPEDQFTIMRSVLLYINGDPKNENSREEKLSRREQILEILKNANPLGFIGNGYPEQTFSYIDRMRMRSLFPYLFDVGVISDAGDYGSPRQKFIADLFGIENMKHMSLNEDKTNLSRQGQLTRVFNEYGGAENLEARAKKRKDIEKRLTEALHIMRPASDAERAGGSFTRLQAIDQYRKIVREAYEMHIPIEVMLGGGHSLNRFGGDVDMVRRILAQELKGILVDKRDRGKTLEPYDYNMMMMATSILYTEQGRSKRLMSATPGQVRDNLLVKTTNMLKDLMDLRGDVDDYLFIDRQHHFSENMKRVQKRIWEHGIEDYATFNQVCMVNGEGEIMKDKNGPIQVLDVFVNKAGPMNIVPFQNYGSRPAEGKAKDEDKTLIQKAIDWLKATVTRFRAIGKDQTLYSMQSFHAGFLGSGNAMARFHNALHKGDAGNKITLKDIDDLMNSPEWEEAIFSRNLIDAGRFNATQLAEKLFGNDAKDWDHDRMMKLGENVIIAKIPDEENWHLRYNGPETVTQEQMYFARIYYGRVRFLAFTEAAITPKGRGVTMENTQEEILAAFKPENGLELGLGKRTQQRWSDVMQTLENHKKNAPLYAINNMIDEDITARKEMDQSQEEINTYYGQGDPSAAERLFRLVSSALRSGTSPHKHKWTGQDGPFMEHKRNIDMGVLIDYVTMQKKNAAYDHELLPG
ncbi:MAG: hypothetical protein OEY94_09915 [Alphaproteobacteria bacterium]|nr:hypothetical protein [Alphaproteobacteria bacterium]